MADDAYYISGDPLTPMNFTQLLSDPVPACADLSKMVPLLFWLATGWHFLYHPSLVIGRDYIKRAGYWKQAKAQQAALLVNFGFPKAAGEDPAFPDGLDENTLAGSFFWTSFVAVHHCLCGAAMLPVVVHGWDGAGAGGQQAFVLASLAAASWDLYDFLNSTCRTFLPNVFMEGAHPLKYWIVLPCLHHIVTIVTILPLNTYMLQNADYHKVACSLLLAAGVCYGLGQYKYTLDFTSSSGLLQVKAIAVIQFVVIVITRAFVFFYCGVRLLGDVHAAFQPALAGTFFGLVSMGVFNLIVIADATAQVHKWIMAPPAYQTRGAEAKSK